MADPKGEKPESDQPLGDDFPLEFSLEEGSSPSAAGHSPGGFDFSALSEDAIPLEPDQAAEGSHAEGEAQPLDTFDSSASTDGFNFSGPAEELDFTEPADFTFPTEQAGGAQATAEPAGETAEAEAGVDQFFTTGEGGFGESFVPEEAAGEPVLVGEGIADLEAAEEPVDEDKPPKSRFQVPGWVRTLEFFALVVLFVSLPLAAIAVFVAVKVWVPDAMQAAKYLDLLVNIECPVALALIPYCLWRWRDRWLMLVASAVYTVMLALGTAALIVGTWFEGLELARYNWQISKTAVRTAKLTTVAPTPATK